MWAVVWWAIARDGIGAATSPHRFRNFGLLLGLPRVSLTASALTMERWDASSARYARGFIIRVDLRVGSGRPRRASLDPGVGRCGLRRVRVGRLGGTPVSPTRSLRSSNETCRAACGFAVPATIMGLGSIRFLVLGMLVILPVAAAAATRFVDVVHERQRAGGALSRPKLVEYTSGRFWVTVLTGIAIVLTPAATIATTMGARPPESALSEMLPEGCTLFSDAASAGPGHSDSTRRRCMDRRTSGLLWSTASHRGHENLRGNELPSPPGRTASCYRSTGAWASLPFRFRSHLIGTPNGIDARRSVPTLSGFGGRHAAATSGYNDVPPERVTASRLRSAERRGC